jgi:hypothetical protein
MNETTLEGLGHHGLRRWRSRLLAVAAAGALAATGLAATPASSAVPKATDTSGDGWCASPTAVPCIVSVSRDGTAVNDGDANWSLTVADTSIDGSHAAQFFVSDPGASVTDPTNPPGGNEFASLPASETSHTWSITVRVDFLPREFDGYGDNMIVDRGGRERNGDYTVTMTGNPVTQGVNAECTTSSWPWSCPSTSGANVTSFFGETSDFQQWNDSSQWDDFDGMTISTNVEASAVPPEISGDPLTISIDLANSHSLAGADQPFQGFYHLTIPNAFLEAMGIDDPSTLDPSGISASIGAGTVVITPGPDSAQVDVTGITFSPHKLKLKRGTITPTRVGGLHVSRTAHRAHLHFTRAKARGSRIRHYQARCLAGHHPTRTATGKHTTVVVGRLVSHTRYTCEVRAVAVAGDGRWSKPKRTKA